ncbi:MAG TPA: hypothetical protein VM238_10675 [Phycisphaerae bacterium]|nr:hypothetical protein [Phycisphaerae bacterium]
MRILATMVLVSLVTLSTPALAASAAPADAAGSTTVIRIQKPATDSQKVAAMENDSQKVAAMDNDGQKVAALENLLAAGKFDELTLEAITFLRGTHDERAKTDAMWLLAVSRRKKGDWAPAQEAYLRLQGRFSKEDDLYLKYDAIAQILKASPEGVWTPPGSTPATDQPPPTLADDAVLTKALTHMADTRAERLKLRIPPLNRARSPQDVAALFAPLAEGLRQARVLSEAMSAEPERAAARAAGTRIASLGATAIASLKAKVDAYQAAYRSGKLTLKQRGEIETYHRLCTELAQAEASFQKALETLGGVSGLAEGQRLHADSVERQRTYEKLAAAFQAPAWDPNGDGWGRGGFDGGPGGGGFGGGRGGGPGGGRGR